MEVFSLAALVALVTKFTSLTKYLSGRDWNGVLTQAYTWAAGVVAAVLAAHASAMSGVAVNGVTLGSLDGASQVLLGLALGSLGSLAYDYKKAKDNTDSAAEPKLVPPGA